MQHESQTESRLYAVVEATRDYYAEHVATGTVAVIESEAARCAPVGAMIIRDGEDGHGVVCAERVITGWVIR